MTVSSCVTCVTCIISPLPQPLPRIDLDNYSALPVDEGDEDRQAGIGDEEYEGSDVDLGDDPDDAGEINLKSILLNLVNTSDER